MCRPKGNVFLAVLVRKRDKIVTIMVLNRAWFLREPRERINVFVFSTPLNKREREVSKIYHSS